MSERTVNDTIAETKHVGVGTTSIIVADIMRRLQPEQPQVRLAEIATNGHKKDGIPPLGNIREAFRPQTA